MNFKIQILIMLVLFGINCHANDNFKAKYKWNLIDFEFETPEDRNDAIKNGSFISENIIAMGIDVDDNRLFLSLPRLKTGVPASLVTVHMNDLTETSSPALKPYPSWQSHRSVNNEDIPDIISPFQLKIDNCNRLWAIDTGVVGVLIGRKPTRLAPTRLLIFDLQTDNIIRRFELPELNSDNFKFLNLVIDSVVCENSYAYIADSQVPPSLTVYSYKTNESWKFKHNFFHMDPVAGNFMDSGIKYPMTVGIYGLALSDKKSLYFHALSSYLEFNVSTEVLQNRNSSASPTEFYKSFKLIGKRDQQAGLSVYDTKRKVIFYTVPNLSGIACWKTDENAYKITNIYADANNMYPMDVKIDEKDRLWFLSNNLHKFFNGKLNGSEINFIVHFIPIEEAIKDTACKQGYIWTFVDKFKEVTRGGNNDSNAKEPALLLVLFGSLFMWVFSKF